MTTFKDKLAAIEKAAKAAVVFGGNYEPVVRVPTGIFPLDLGIGGGIPRGRITEIYGPEGGGKTNLAIKCIAQNQAVRPDQTNVFIDMEGTWDPHWAKALGCDPKKVAVIRPDYVEQVGDLLYEVLDAKDLGVCVLDSLGVLDTEKSIEGEMDKASYGGSTIPIGRMTRKVVHRLKEKRDAEGDQCALIWINQTRASMAMYGDPEKTPGGNQPRFAYSLRLRISSKNVIEEKISATMPLAKKTNIMVKKHKVAITALNIEYNLVTLNHGNYKIGDVDDWHLVEKLLRDYDLLSKGKKNWELTDFETGEVTEFKTLALAEDYYRCNIEWRLALQKHVIEREVKASGFIMEDEAQEALPDAA